MKRISFLVVFLFFVMSCATNRAVVKQDYDFSQIKTIRVENFADSGYENSGSVVKNAFVKQLLEKGYKVVVDKNLSADVVIEGSLTAYNPDKKYLVNDSSNEKRGRRQTVVYNNQITEIGGSNVYDLGTAFGMGKNSRVVASNATVGIYAYMIDAKTSEVIWSASYTYEGLDLSTALEGAVKYILRTIPQESIVN